MILKRIKRDTKGRFTKRKSILVALAIIAIVFTGAIYSKSEYVVEAQVVDERDNIQKITDEIAKTYRELERTQAQLSKAEEEHIKALDNYKSSLDSFAFYSK